MSRNIPTNSSRFVASRLFAAVVASSLLLSAGTSSAGKCPNIQIVLDRSGSMISPMDSSTRWATAVNTIKAGVSSLDGMVPIGLSVFPDTDGLCDSVTSVHPAYSTKTAIFAALDASGPDGGTPSGTAIRDVAAITELHDVTRPQYVILITDGVPNCGPDPDTSTGVVTELQKAYAATPSIPTFVIGIGSDFVGVDLTTINNMADAGGRPLSGTTKYYAATTGSALTTAMLTIVNAISTEVGACSDTVVDMGGMSDMRGVPTDMRGSPTDLSVSDMRGGPTDLSVNDMRGVPTDMRGITDLRLPSLDGPPIDQVDLGSGGNPAPIVDWIEPNMMLAGTGGPAQITGRNFVSSIPSSEVYFDSGTNLTIVSNVLVDNFNQIKVTIGADMPVGVYDVVVKNPDGQTGRVVGGFTIASKSSGCACSLGKSATRDSSAASAALFAGMSLLALAFARSRRRTVRV
jgi:hypothetical protein